MSDDEALNKSSLSDRAPLLSVEPGKDRIALFTSEEWSDSYTKLLPFSQFLLSTHGYWTFHEASDVVINGLDRFVKMENPEIRSSMGCYWHLKFHVKYGYLDVMRDQLDSHLKRQINIDDQPESWINDHGPASTFLGESNPVEHNMDKVELQRRVLQLYDRIEASGGRKEHMKAVLSAILYEDIGTGASSTSNMKIAKRTGLNIDQVVAAKRRLQRLGAQIDE